MDERAKARRFCLRLLVYLLGTVSLAAGLVLNTKTSLGVSAIISIPYSISQIWTLDFANVTLAAYCVFVLVQMLLHAIKQRPGWKRLLLLDILQIPLSVIFTRFMNVFTAVIPDFATQFSGSFLGSFWGRFLFLLLAVVLTGVGAAFTLYMRLIPNPGDGIVQAIADFTGMKIGDMKNIFDLCCIVFSTCLSLIFAHKVIGIGIGTLAAMLGTGRVIALCNLTFGKTFERLVSSGSDIIPGTHNKP